MAYSVLRTCGTVLNTIRHCKTVSNVGQNLLKTSIPLVQNARFVNFYNSKTAKELWKGVTSVSNAGRKRGRARTLTRKKNLHKNQIIGMGKHSLVLPGLNTPIFRGREITPMSLKPKILTKEEEEAQQLQLSKSTSTKTSGRVKSKVSPLDRGWSGGKSGGKKLGPPETIDGEAYDGFESWMLEFKVVSHMTGNLGRRRRPSCFIVTGNRNGLAGFSLVKAPDGKKAIALAKMRAGKRLFFVERRDDHTVLHDFFCQFGSTRIFVNRMPKGSGLSCHRAIQVCCEAVGIKDLCAKVEGAMNVQHIVKAFFIGLLQQKSYQAIADEKKLHVVEFKKENGYFPTVLASPTVVRDRTELSKDESMLVTDYILDGRVPLRRPKKLPFYTHLKSYENYLRKNERYRDQDSVRTKLIAEYGEIRSFLADEYPEARVKPFRKKSNEETADG